VKNIIIVTTTFIAVCGAAQAQSWTGKASYYRGRGSMTCAHRSLPFGTHVRVTNLSNNRSAVLVVNDRGPFIRGRVIDVSTGAADALGFLRAGVARVTVETDVD
jgi:rare lipoprotein A